MPRLLILLTLPPDVTEQYRARLSKLFPAIEIEVAATADAARPALARADMLLTFGQMMKNLKLDLAGAEKLKWVQALGTGLDGITDQPALKPDVTVTSLHGVHGAPVSEAALATMLALARDLPGFVRAQDEHAWKRWPARLLYEKTVCIFGIGVIAAALAPKCKAMGMTVIGISSAPRDAAGFRPHASHRRAAQGAAGMRSFRAADAVFRDNSPHDRRQGVRGDEADRASSSMWRAAAWSTRRR